LRFDGALRPPGLDKPSSSRCSSPPPHINPDLMRPISAFETMTVLRPHHTNAADNINSNSSIHSAHSRTLNLNAFPPSRATRPTPHASLLRYYSRTATSRLILRKHRTSPLSLPFPVPASPATSLLLSKPFKCPKPNCNKSYKQVNGLEYHITHGGSNFTRPKDLKRLQTLLASKRRANASASAAMDDVVRNSNSTSSKSSPNPSHPLSLSHLSKSTSINEVDTGYGLTDSGQHEVEREAARRVRLFAYGVSDCRRRYKI